MADIINSPPNSSDDHFTVEEGSKTLFDISFFLATCYVIIVIILSVVGVCGNAFIIYVMKKEKQMNAEARSFIINMAVGDLCVAGIADPMCIAGAFLGMDYLHGGFWFCVGLASMCLTACISVFLNMVSLTVNRWICLCHENIYSRIYNRKSTIAICVATWVIAFGMELPNYFGFGGHYFDEKSHQCIWDRTSSRTYTLFVALGIITCPLLLLACCNIAMFRKIWTVKRNLSVFAFTASFTLRSSMKSAKILLTMLLVFVVCWVPYVIVLVVDAGDQFPLEVHLFTTLLAHTHSSSSCLIYLGFKKNFRGYLRSLFQRNRVHQSSSSQGRELHNCTVRTLTIHASTGTPTLGKTATIFPVLP